MPVLRRLTNTPAIMARSDFCPVSFSTMDAMISASYGFLYGKAGSRLSHASDKRPIMAACACLKICISLAPLANR